MKLDEAGGWARLAAAMGGLKERAKTLRELIDGAHYLYADRPIALDDKAAKLLDAEGRAGLAALIPRLEAVESWTAPTLEGAVRAYAEETGRKLGKVAQPVRAALTGRSISPPGLRRHGRARPRRKLGATQRLRVDGGQVLPNFRALPDLNAWPICCACAML